MRAASENADALMRGTPHVPYLYVPLIIPQFLAHEYAGLFALDPDSKTMTV